MERPRRHDWLVNVIETPAVGCKGKSAQVSARKHIGKRFAICDVQTLESRGALSSFFHLIEQHTSIGRNPKRFNGGVLSSFPVCRIQQNLVFALHTLTHANA